MIYCFSVSEIIWSYFGSCFHTAAKKWLSRDVINDVSQTALGFILVTAPTDNKFTSHKYGVSHTKREITILSIMTAIDSLQCIIWPS